MKQGKRIILILASILLTSLILHLVEFHHDHPHEIFGEGIQATLHGEDKKYWAILLILKFLALAGVFSLISFFGLYFLFSQNLKKIIYKYNYLLECLSRGILQPKLCH